MRHFFLLLIMMTGGVTAADKPNPGAKDNRALQGLWQAVGAEFGGQKAPAEGNQGFKNFQVEFKGDQIIFNPATAARSHTLTVNPEANPKTMDLTAGDGPKKGQKLPCAIYKLDGDKLTICIDKEGKFGTRPMEFKTAPRDGLALIVLERVTVTE